MRKHLTMSVFIEILEALSYAHKFSRNIVITSNTRHQFKLHQLYTHSDNLRLLLLAPIVIQLPIHI
jgi:hypothetical protein